MNVPTAIPLSEIPQGGVFSTDLSHFWMNLGGGAYCDLAAGVYFTGEPVTNLFYYFPGAALVIE